MAAPTLLGHLARFGSFTTQSELLCTQGLTYLLQTYEDARLAMASMVEDCTGVVIDPSLTWKAETRQEDRSRPDLEACSPEGVPVVKIEAKLSAQLFVSQVRSYVTDLQTRNNLPSAMLVLVPEGRITEAARLTASALGITGSGPWRITDGPATGIAVISWNQLFDALLAGEAAQFRHELEQLQAMYHVLSGDFIAPLADEEDLLQWRERETDLVNVVDQVTRRLTTQHQVYPMLLQPLDGASLDIESSGYRFRYVCPLPKSCFSIGVRDPFKGWVTPVWMRFHKSTGNFLHIRQHIEDSAVQYRLSSGHIWIPLEVPLDASAEKMIQALVDEAGEIVRIAFQIE